MTNMKAVELRPAHGGGTLSIASRPVPKPGRGEVLVRVRAASLNFRDLLVADHMYGALPETVVPLSDGAGEIAALGEGVSGLVPGQRVAGAFYPDWITGPITAAARTRSLGANIDGMLAQYALLPAHAAIPVPDHLSDEEAATLPCAGLTAWNALLVRGRTYSSLPGEHIFSQMIWREHSAGAESEVVAHKEGADAVHLHEPLRHREQG